MIGKETFCVVLFGSQSLKGRNDSSWGIERFGWKILQPKILFEVPIFDEKIPLLGSVILWIFALAIVVRRYD